MCAPLDLHNVHKHRVNVSVSLTSEDTDFEACWGAVGTRDLRGLGVSTATIYRRHAKYGVMDTSMAVRLTASQVCLVLDY
jgi:hypothetical protein